MTGRSSSTDALATLLSGVEQVVPKDGLERKLSLGRPLRVKFGVDPSRPDLHLGHAVPLRKLRQFQELGHVAVLIIGDFTGRVGDPSGRSETRVMLSTDQIEANARTYLDQAERVLDMEAAAVRRNSEWLAPMGMDDVLRLTSSTTVAQMLERDDFRARYREQRPISVVEFLYPLLQGMDSIQIEADVELGGTDQTFNLLMGRELQQDWGQEPQVVMTVPLLEGIDGVRKMSKSFDNAVGLTDAPDEMFGRLMSVPDGLIARYLRLCTLVDPVDVEKVESGLAEGSLHPNEEKRRMAREVVDLYHGPGAGELAERAFLRVFRDHELPEEMPEAAIPDEAVGEGAGVWLPRLMVLLGLASSNGEARRLILGGGVRLGGEVVADPDVEIARQELADTVLQVGRRRHVRLR